MAKSKMIKRLPLEATLSPDMLTRENARNAFWDARKQLSNVPEMTIDEINAEIVAARKNMNIKKQRIYAIMRMEWQR